MTALLSSLNYLAVLVAGLAYWVIGAVWFSAIAGKSWSAELEKHGVKIKQPTKPQMMTKLVSTFLLNVLLAFGMALLLKLTAIADVPHAIKLGLLAGVCICLTTIGVIYTWESRSLKLYFLDAAYPLIGITACSVILTLWK
jgi:hypothetical protein